MLSMSERREQHAVCNIGQRIFIFGGYNPENDQSSQTCEAFNVLANTWTFLPFNLPDKYVQGMTAEVAKNRYIFLIGGINQD